MHIFADKVFHIKTIENWKSSLQLVELRGAKLVGIDLFSANLEHARMFRAILANADLSNSNLFDANFHGADLHRGDLHESYCKMAVFIGANLNEADFETPTSAELIS